MRGSIVRCRWWRVSMVLLLAIGMIGSHIQPVEAHRKDDPADPSASKETRKLLRYLQSLPKSGKTLSGQHLSDESAGIADAYMHYIDALKEQTGKYVALIGAGYMGDHRAINAVLKHHWANNGLVTLDLHPSNPWTGGSSWVSDGRAPKPDLRELLDPTTVAGARWRAELDAIAAGLQELEDADVVVIWRPLHEMNGNWFWWGVDMTDPTETQSYKDVWIDMFNYFTHTKGLHNLLWVYSAATSWDAPVTAFYPGDEYVDLVGYDRYDDTLGEWTDSTTGETSTDYADLKSLGKPMAFTEVGPTTRDGSWDTRTILRRMRESDVQMAYFLEWHSWVDNGLQHVALVDNQNAKELLKDRRVITLDEVPRHSKPPKNKPKPITPVVECVIEHGTDRFTAFFGYHNPNGGYVFVPGGQPNQFTAVPHYRSQTLVFAPGRSPAYPNAAFGVAFDGSAITWQLQGRRATASRETQRCGSTLPTDNLLQNAGFETGDTTGWSPWFNFAVSGDDRYGGNYAAQIASPSEAGGGDQKVAAAPNTTYTLSAWGKVTGGQWGAVGYVLFDAAGQSIGGENYLPSFGTAYGYRTATFTTTADTATIQVQVWSNGGGVLYLDDVGLARN